MKRYKLTLAEQETVINFDNELPTASIYTHDARLRRKLEELSKQYPEQLFFVGRGRDGQSRIPFQKDVLAFARLTVKNGENSRSKTQRSTACLFQIRKRR